MAQLYSTGPANMYIGAAGSTPSAALYLGTAEEAPEIQLNPKYLPVQNDLGGASTFEASYQGELAQSAAVLTRWNESTLAIIQNRPAPASILGRGTNGPLDVGSLIGTEALNLIFYIQFPFVAKAAMAAGGMPPGYRFPFSIPMGPEALKPLGTLPRKISLVFWHLRQFQPTSPPYFLLYDFAVAGLPPIN